MMFTNLADLALDLTREQNEYLFGKIQAVPLQAWDEQGVLFLKAFSINAHEVAAKVRPWGRWLPLVTLAVLSYGTRSPPCL